MIAGFGLPDQLIWLAFVSAVAVFTVAVGLYVLFVPSAAEQRLAGFVGTARSPTRPGGLDSRGRPLDFLRALDRQLRRRQQAASTRMLLVRANSALSVAEFVALRVGSGLLGAVLVAFEAFPRLGPPSVLVAVVAGLLASFLPPLYLGILVSRRLAKFEAQLPDALDLMAASLQSGGALTQSFGLIARDMPAPMSEEFQRVLREVEVGLSVNEALTNLSLRIGSDDLDLAVTTINVQTKIGGNLVQILRTITATIRDRSRIRGEIRVLTAQQRLASFVIAGIPPALGVIIYFLNPEYIGRLFQPGIGEVLLILSVIMAFAGFLILHRITNIDI